VSPISEAVPDPGAARRPLPCHERGCHTLSYVMERIEWSDEAASHIRNRSVRYSEAVGIEPKWTVEVVNDPNRLVDEPDPKSAHLNSVRTVGYSHTARMVITVAALRAADGTLRGASAWKTTGGALRQYLEGVSGD